SGEAETQGFPIDAAAQSAELARRLADAGPGAQAVEPAMGGAALILALRTGEGDVAATLAPSPLAELGAVGAPFEIVAAANGLSDGGVALRPVELSRAAPTSAWAEAALVAALAAFVWRLSARRRPRRAAEAFGARALEATTDFALLLDRNGTIRWANRATLEGVGRRMSEVRGLRPGDIFFANETDPAAVQAFRAAIRDARGYRTRVTLRAGGETIDADANMTPIDGDDGLCEGFVVIIRDLVESGELARRLESAIEAVGFCFFVIGADERFLVTNRAHRELMSAVGVDLKVGETYADMLERLAASGLADYEGMDPPAWAAARLAHWRASERREGVISTRDGRRLLQRCVTTELGDKVSVATDVTELIEARAAAEAAAEEKSRLAATITHELRTPLIGVISMAELVLESDLSDEQRGSVALIRDSGRNLLDVINDILDLSKLEAGKLAIREERLDLVETVEDVVALLAPSAAAKGLELAIRFGPEARTPLRGDAGRIRQILTNLVGNAVKFTNEGGVVVRIECGPPAVKTPSVAAPDAGEVAVALSVEDTGAGVAEEDLARIFAPYEQVGGPALGVDRGGSGLGLAICREL
ncbi:MAG: histidine kinase dimerization/phospho-acceptor domain-containing protein, partial [Pseudomonadota bacterium]